MLYVKLYGVFNRPLISLREEFKRKTYGKFVNETNKNIMKTELIQYYINNIKRSEYSDIEMHLRPLPKENTHLIKELLDLFPKDYICEYSTEEHIARVTINLHYKTPYKDYLYKSFIQNLFKTFEYKRDSAFFLQKYQDMFVNFSSYKIKGKQEIYDTLKDLKGFQQYLSEEEFLKLEKQYGEFNL